MIEPNHLHVGNEGVVYPLEKSDDVVKVFFTYSLFPDKVSPEESVQYLYDLFKGAKEQGLNVPQVRDMIEIKGDKLAIPNPFRKIAEKRNLPLDEMTFYGIVKEYIHGKCLGNNFVPSRNLQLMVKQTYKDFLEKEYVITDARASNFVLNQKNGLYMIDEGSLHTLADARHFNLYKKSVHGSHTFYGDKLLYGYYLAEGLVHVGKYLLQQKKEKRKK